MEGGRIWDGRTGKVEGFGMKGGRIWDGTENLEKCALTTCFFGIILVGNRQRWKDLGWKNRKGGRIWDSCCG